MKTNNYTIEFHKEEFDYVADYISKHGVWEKRTTDFIKETLKPGMTFVDVGAQAGYYTLLAHSLGAKVLAFEPSTKNRELLEKNIKDNDFSEIEILSFALSNKDEKVKLYDGKTSGENSLVDNGKKFEEVDSIKWDNLNREIPNIIKIDVEGFEKQVLEGMSDILNTDKEIYIIIEDWYNKVTDWLIDNYGFKLITTDRGFGNRILVKNKEVKEIKEPLRIHLLGVFNTPTTLADEGIGNAFGSKVIRMAKILKKLGHYVIFYGVEGSDVECDEFVQVSTKDILEKTYGPWEKDKVYGCKRGDLAHTTFNDNAIKEINKRKLFGDFLLCCFGSYQKPIADAVNIADTIEIGIGYTGSFARFRIFESEFQKNWSYGAEGKGDIGWYDKVISGYFEPEDFTFSKEKDDYYLYLGRVVSRKGVSIAQEVCQKLGKKLIIAGFGMTVEENKVDGEFFNEIIKRPNVEYVGFAGKEKRRELMSKAKAVFMPTQYLEPFGYVAIEAMFSGTPVITTDGGAFPETNINGLTGYRCNTFADFIKAVEDVEKLDPEKIRQYAMDNFTLEKAIPKYDEYFNRILNLYGKGWYK